MGNALDDEVEVTSAMIAVASEILKDHFYEEIFDKGVDLSKICSDLFRAMYGCRRSSQAQDRPLVDRLIHISQALTQAQQTGQPYPTWMGFD